MSDSLSNRHPVDQLAAVRTTIKRLQDQEKTLKDQIGEAMGSADSLGGDEFIAFQKVSERKGAIDEKALAAVGIDVNAYRKPPVSVYTLTVEARAVEAS